MPSTTLPRNYREVPLNISGRQFKVAGFQRPTGASTFTQLKENGVGAVISLDGMHASSYLGAGLDAQYYKCGTNFGVYDWFNRPYTEENRTRPEIYDNIYNAIMEAEQAGKKTAIHCGAGDGRTGTVLSSLMLRQLLQEELKTINQENGDLERINVAQEKSGIIHMLHGVNGRSGGDVKVTPLVKKAIERVRQLSNHPHSVESRNDVESLMLYERHLRALFSLNPGSVLAEGADIPVNNEIVSDEQADIPVNTVVVSDELADITVNKEFVSDEQVDISIQEIEQTVDILIPDKIDSTQIDEKVNDTLVDMKTSYNVIDKGINNNLINKHRKKTPGLMAWDISNTLINEKVNYDLVDKEIESNFIDKKIISNESITLSESNITTDTKFYSEKLTDDEQAQLKAVVEAVEHGTPQPTESFISRLIQGVQNVFTQIRDYIAESVQSISNSMGISGR